MFTWRKFLWSHSPVRAKHPPSPKWCPGASLGKIFHSRCLGSHFQSVWGRLSRLELGGSSVWKFVKGLWREVFENKNTKQIKRTNLLHRSHLSANTFPCSSANRFNGKPERTWSLKNEISLKKFLYRWYRHFFLLFSSDIVFLLLVYLAALHIL